MVRHLRDRVDESAGVEHRAEVQSYEVLRVAVAEQGGQLRRGLGAMSTEGKEQTAEFFLARALSGGLETDPQLVGKIGRGLA